MLSMLGRLVQSRSPLFSRLSAWDVDVGGASGLCSTVAGDVYDVVIVGAGMVGAGLASGLGSNPMTSGLRVALVDHKVPDTKQNNELDKYPELRVSTLTPASMHFVQQCGAWKDVQDPRSASFSHMQVWDYGAPGFLQWSAKDVGTSSMGIIVENSLLQSAFLKSALATPNVTGMFPNSVAGINFPDPSIPGDASLAKVHLTSGETFFARLVVGADGAQSKVRSMAQLRTVSWDHGQRAFVATVKIDRPTDTAWQRFLPTGPLALLPVRGGYCNVVWSTTPKMAADLEDSEEDAVVGALNEALHGGPDAHESSIYKLGRLLGMSTGSTRHAAAPVVTNVVGSKPRSFPLKSMYTGRYVRPRLALIGDAAHVVHPLAGQGVNLGIGDAAELTECLSQAVEVGQDIGDAAMLQRDYEGPRKIANTSMGAALLGVKKAFEFQQGLFPAARTLGLDLLNITPAVKNGIMRFAMGTRRPGGIL